jgi:tetratricopeptide (TPR) repeat protein
VRHRTIIAILASWGFVTAFPAAAADTYWSYNDNGTEIVAGTSGRTLELSHHIARFDKALTRILGLSDVVNPIHVYELSHADAALLMNERGSAHYNFSGYETTVVTDTDADSNNGDWGVLFGYAGGLIVTGRALRCPHWYLLGVPQVFAHTRFEAYRLSTGGVVGEFVQTLRLEALIPSRVFLNLRGNDPQLNDRNFLRRYEAQSWYLAHEIFVEGLLRTEFDQYLKLLREGNKEGDAFAQSFKFSYEELDSKLMQAMHQPPHVYVVKVPPDEENRGLPHQLSAAESRARLAELLLNRKRLADALRIAAEAHRADSHNELALRVTARADWRDAKYDAAWNAVEELNALPKLSAAALTDSGEVSSDLARVVADKGVTLGIDADALKLRAEDAFEHAIGLDSEYLRAWVGLANLYGRTRDTAAAEALTERAKPIMEKHSSNDVLARSLATMCAQTRQSSAAFLFGEFWRNNAISLEDLDQATAFMGRLKAN